MSPVGRWVVGCAVVLAAGVPIVAHAMHERRAQHAEIQQLDALTQQLMRITKHAKTAHHVYVNGLPVFFRTSTSSTNVAATLDAIRHDCESGDPRTMLGLPPEADDGAPPPHSLLLSRVERQEEEDDVGATLCIFHASKEAQTGSNGGAQIRYSLVHRVDDTTTSVFTVATEASAPLEALFPAEGDVPGGDFEGVPRPHDSRRAFAATLQGEDYGVRIYETRDTPTDVVTKYDADMAQAGFSRSAAVADARPDVRVYSRGAEEFVASFESVDGTTRVAVAPIAAQ